jgi:hypothetical protein
VSKRKKAKEKMSEEKRAQYKKGKLKKVTMLSGWRITRITITNCQPRKCVVSMLVVLLTSFPFIQSGIFLPQRLVLFTHSQSPLTSPSAVLLKPSGV